MSGKKSSEPDSTREKPLHQLALSERQGIEHILSSLMSETKRSWEWRWKFLTDAANIYAKYKGGLYPKIHKLFEKRINGYVYEFILNTLAITDPVRYSIFTTTWIECIDRIRHNQFLNVCPNNLSFQILGSPWVYFIFIISYCELDVSSALSFRESFLVLCLIPMRHMLKLPAGQTLVILCTPRCSVQVRSHLWAPIGLLT